MSQYLTFALDTFQTLLNKQAARLGGKPDGPLCLTITKKTEKTYRSIGRPAGNTYQSFLCQAQPMEDSPTRLDMDSWEMLDLLSEVTGDARYREMALAMARGFAEYGFHPRSGLGYLGQECQFDAVQLQPAGVGSKAEAKFKPAADLPLDILWSASPDRMARMFKSAFYGLMMRPENFEFNRFCSYDFDDREKKPSMPFNPTCIAFATTGAMLTQYWSFLYARTGDEESLSWAQKMTGKWQAVQHPETGLLPHSFASEDPSDNRQPPRTYCRMTDTIAAHCFLSASRELRARPEGLPLAEQLHEMARRMLVGIARHSYDPETHTFIHWLRLDGAEDTTAVWYTFPTQEMKDAAVRINPILREVAVFSRLGFYRDAPWAFGVRNILPHDVSLGALLTGDRELLDHAVLLADHVMEEATRLKGEFNDEGQWTVSATALYIEMMLNLLRLTGEPRYLDQARQLADMELEFLSRPMPEDKPDWWRMSFRNEVLKAFLRLDVAMRGGNQHDHNCSR